MAMFKRKNLSVPSNTYRTPKGSEHVFWNNSATFVSDPEDIKYFRGSPDYEEVGVAEKIMDTVKDMLPKESKDDFKKKLRKIKSIGPEIADAIVNKFDSFEHFRTNIDRRSLIEMSGIGKERADEIMKQLKKEE
jgi:NAD-dependent DNA ligase